MSSFRQFLALRAIFGIAMGGIWGLASATALENLPVQLRGLASGILQEGYALGYLIAAVVNLTLVPEQRHGWRALFWTSAGLSFLAAVIRALLPESEVFLRAQRIEREKAAAAGVVTGSREKSKIFLRETWTMLKHHWKLWIYAVLLMSGFNFLSHGSQVGHVSRLSYFLIFLLRICSPPTFKSRNTRQRTRLLLLQSSVTA